ncbi:MAG: glycoside hydrolase family 127 protein [Candidatus Hydrogenedentes bacterium]|nr:glycoside hydrolase family 127 protein [Candidatus Hydrogenedentota bacterium]
MISSLQFLLPLAAFGAVAVPAHAAQTAIEARGELARRIELVRDRMLHGDVPRFSDDFILADIALRPDYPRRFAEYSGDVSGRVIGAYAMMPSPQTDAHLKELARAALQFQKGDGRFGSAALEFTPEKVGQDHMALLWGNGRLLVGLLEYNSAQPEPDALKASQRLGDFLLKVYDGCANPQVAERVKDFGAGGMICFTQLIEGLVMLSQATHDHKYIDGAERILPWIQKDRGKQHTHGYLSTLRGVVMLYEATKDAKHLAMVEELYAGLVNSPDYTIYGGVMEYFGGKGDRSEGCSEADFLRLSLQLWRVTGKTDYLENAERNLLNEFYGNQFATGDFGHHWITSAGISPCLGSGRAWWCCTMHGLRAFRDVLDSVVTAKDGLVRINLFEDAVWSDKANSLAIAWNTASGSSPQLSVTVEKAAAEGARLTVRKPAWASVVSVNAAGANATAKEEGGYLFIDRALHAGERVDVSFTCQPRLVKRDGVPLVFDQLAKEPVQAALFYGPWLLGVDEVDNSPYFNEPIAGNRVTLPREFVSDGAAGLRAVPCAHVKCSYVHDGFPGTQSLTLRPVSERSAHEPASFAVWLNYTADK